METATIQGGFRAYFSCRDSTGSILTGVRVGRIELPLEGWKPPVLPLNYTRIYILFATVSVHPFIFRARATPNSFLPKLRTDRWAVP